MVMQLRYYQQEAIDAAWAALEQEPDSNPCIVLPTGAGKTPVVAALCKQMYEWGGKTVVLTHVKELVQQNYNTLLRNAPELKHDIGVYSAGLNKRDTGHDILVAGIQSIFRRAYQIDARNLIIVDEAHLIPTVDSGMYRTFLKNMKINNPHVKIIGLTATPYRLGSGYICQPDGILNKICYEADVKTLIEEGYLSRLISAAGVVKTDLSGVHIRGGDYVESELQTAVNEDALVLEACKELVASTQERKSILVFAAGVEHGENIIGKLRDLGQKADSIYGETATPERDRKINAFKSGELKILVNVGVLTTGFDYPGIDCVVLLRPTLSPGLYYQMCGRGLRLAEGKKDALILDFGGNILRHGPIDMIKIKPKKAGNSEPGEAPAKECPGCHKIIAAASTTCPFCGQVFEREVKHGTEASHAGILSNEATLETKQVEAVYYSKHTKRGAPHGTPATMKVSYHCKGQYFGAPDIISEWVCFEHEGFARNKALQWWKKRVQGVKCPSSVDEALSILLETDMSENANGNGVLPMPGSITISQPKGDEKFPRIVGYGGLQVAKFEEAIEHPESVADRIAERWGLPIQQIHPAHEIAGYTSQEEAFDDVPF